MSQKKYEITEITHPKYPWLHRIRARCQVNEQVGPGALGGYVQTEDNLSQDGTCWIYDQAICCEEAVVEDDGRMFDGAVARGSALISGDARMFERAVAEGNSSFFSGELKEDARLSGNAVVNRSDNGLSPLIGRKSNVYGSVCGWFVVNDNIFEGEHYLNRTEDMFILENGKREVLVKQRKLEPPEEYRNEKSKREDRENFRGEVCIFC